MYKLSLIIPIYHVESYIQDCLESVLNQLPQNVQVICINDGTTDKSMTICRDTLAKYSQKTQNQFLLIDQENQGLSGARNTGINAASGDYISFLDSDDRILPNYFDTILNVLNQKDYDLVDFNLITSEGNLLKTNNNSFDSVFSLMSWFCPARVFKKSLFKKFRFTPGILYEDLDLTPRLYLEAESILHLNVPLYWYRSNEKGITRTLSHSNNIKTIESLEKILNRYYSLYKSSNNPYYAIVTLQSYYLLCVSACRRFSLIQGIKYYKKYKGDLHALEKNLIGLKDLDRKIVFFYKNPILYLLIYSKYNNFRNILNKL